MTLLLVFGTSTTYGAWDKEGGWVARLRKYLDENQSKDPELYYIVHNLGIPGDTSKGILERIEFESKQRLKLRDEGEEVIFLIHAGVNDAIINNKTKQFHVPLKDFEKNIEKLIKIARSIGSKTVFIGNKPVNEKLVDPIPWLPGHSYLNKYVGQYENKGKEVCLKNNVPFIDIFNYFKNKGFQTLHSDGVHLNSKGHEEMYEIVRDFLIKNKII